MSEIPSFPLPQQVANGVADVATSDHETIRIKTPILVVGGGPVGLLTAYTLSYRYSQPCVLLEASPTTTMYPKMEFTNGRSMELYKQLGIGEQFRATGVPERYTLNEIITTGLAARPGCKPVTVWERDSPEVLRRKDKQTNDGTRAREPYMRCSQIRLEKLLKEVVEKEDNIETYFGWRLVGLKETPDGVVSEAVASDGSGRKMQITSQYLVGCDGGGSLVRKEIGVKSERKNLNMNFIFVHIRSRDPILKSQGQFWHLMTLSGALIVAQDEEDTYTWHFIVPEEVANHPERFDAMKAIREGIGGLTGEADVAVDEILIMGIWKSQIAAADSFSSKGGRVFLAGDSAHQLSPAGGHGLNSGLGDLWNLTWKLSAVVKGWGSQSLLPSYNTERRPVSLTNIQMVEKGTADVLLPLSTLTPTLGKELLLAESEEGERARAEVEETMKKGYWIHHQDGVTLGLKYEGSPTVVYERLNGYEETQEEEWNLQQYTPSTKPGGRPPHVWLKDGVTSIFDLFTGDFNVVDFTDDAELGRTFVYVAKELGVPVKMIHLPNEEHVRKLWQQDVVLVRPDGIVGWRQHSGTAGEVEENEVRRVLKVVSGRAP